VPLLEALCKSTEEGAPLLRIPPPEDCAELVRKDLLASRSAREELHADDGERQHFTFHGLRHTCLTHWAVAGRPLQWLLLAAGHTSSEVTQRCVDSAVVLRGTFGQPHPPLPEALVREVAENTMRNTMPNASKLSKLLRPNERPTPNTSSRSNRRRFLRAFAASSDIGLLASHGRRSPRCSYQAAAKGKCRGSGEDNAPERLVNNCSPRVMVSRSPTRHPALTAPADPG
jgi:Phage integrase family